MMEGQFEAARAVGRALQAAGLVYPGAGALSVWTPEGVFITREGALLDDLNEADWRLIGRTTEASLDPGYPALDTPIHRAIFVATGSKAIVHAHPPYVTAWSLDHSALTPADLDGRHLFRDVSIVQSRRSVVDIITAAMERSRAVIVAGHGSYVRGADLGECLRLTAALEASARLLWLRASLPPAPQSA